MLTFGYGKKQGVDMVCHIVLNGTVRRAHLSDCWVIGQYVQERVFRVFGEDCGTG